MTSNLLVTKSIEILPRHFELINMINGTMKGFKKVVMKDVVKCMCVGCKFMFPIIAVVRDFNTITEAQARVISKGCQDHNSLVLKNMEDC